MLKKLIAHQAINLDLALLILRVGTSLLLARHGYDKLHDLLAGAKDFPDPLHIGPVASLTLTVIAEFFCAILLALGLWGRGALLGLIICMAVIAFGVNDPSIDDKEHALLYLFAFVALFLSGTGQYSLDQKLFKH
jgi:putative oxidoreductase